MQYKDIQKPELIRGLKHWKNEGNGFEVVMLHYTADINKDPERNGASWLENEKKGMPKSKWNKEYEIDFSTKSGQLVFSPDFCDYNEDVHCIASRPLPDPVEYILSLDFGQRNPTCVLIGAVMMDGTIYIIDEYYRPNIPSRTANELLQKFEYLIGDTRGLTMEDVRRKVSHAFQLMLIDPTTRAKNRIRRTPQGDEEEYSVLEEFYDHGFDFELANNDVEGGITRIREFFTIYERGKSGLYIFRDKCPNLVKELSRYRYKEHTETTEKTKNKSEEVVKKDDHAVDALRYMIMEKPFAPHKREKPLTIVQKDIIKLINLNKNSGSQLLEKWDSE